MKIKPYYILAWPIITVIGFLFSNPVNWSDFTWISLGVNISVPVVIYLILRQRAVSKVSTSV